jgi:hypothetical protein
MLCTIGLFSIYKPHVHAMDLQAAEETVVSQAVVQVVRLALLLLLRPKVVVKTIDAEEPQARQEVVMVVVVVAIVLVHGDNPVAVMAVMIVKNVRVVRVGHALVSDDKQVARPVPVVVLVGRVWI